MRFPSISKLAKTASSVVKRFPFEILSALIGTIAATINVEVKYTNSEFENIVVRLMMAAELSLLLSFSATLFAEANKLNYAKKLMLRLAAVFLAVGLFFLIHPAERALDYLRFFLLLLGFHLLIAFAAFTGKNYVYAFWQFNKTLFLRILTAALYSIVLFLGIAAAISATNLLFGFKFEWDTYSILWFWIAGIFNTTFFLAGVPGNFAVLEDDYSYPKGLKLFTQYVLIPLATIYVVILLAYEIKILLAWNLPKGLVSNLVLGYAVFGILSLLLVFPIRNAEENKWLKSYSRYFYVLLIPLLLLLFVAVGTRVSRYGVTESRYFLIALALWLLAITLYFLLSKKQNIKLIPMSLCLVTLLSVYGPQSAFAVSEYSQRQILIGIFKKYHAFQNGKLLTMPKSVTREDGNHAAAALHYLVHNHDFSSIQSLCGITPETTDIPPTKLKSKKDHTKIEAWGTKDLNFAWAKEKLGLTKFSANGYDDEVAIDNNRFQTYYLFPNKPEFTTVKGYDYLINASSSKDSVRLMIGKDTFFVIQNFQLQSHILKINSEKADFRPEKILALLAKPDFNLKRYSKSATLSQSEHFDLPADNFYEVRKVGDFIVNFQISMFSYTKNNKGRIEVLRVEGYYLIKHNSF